MEEKTYKERNMKFLISLIFLLLFSVTILLYLFSLGNFLPENSVGEYNILNIIEFFVLSFICISSFISLITYFFLKIVLKKENGEPQSVKFGILVSLGISLVFFLNFLHILNIYWGIGVLIVLIIASFII